jgi:hypothetical protein
MATSTQPIQINRLREDAELAAAFALAKFYFGDVLSARLWAARSEHYWRQWIAAMESA